MIYYCFRCGAERDNKLMLDVHIRKASRDVCQQRYLSITKKEMINRYDRNLAKFLRCKKRVDKKGTQVLTRTRTREDEIKKYTGGLENFDYTKLNNLVQLSKAMSEAKANSTNTTGNWSFDNTQDIVVNNYSNEMVTHEYLEKVIDMAARPDAPEPFLYIDAPNKRIVYIEITVKEVTPGVVS